MFELGRVVLAARCCCARPPWCARLGRVTSLKKVKLKTTLPYMGLDRLVPARETDAVMAEECLRLYCDSIQAATCLLTNEVGLAPVSNREVTLRKLVTKKPVVFVVFDNRVEFEIKRQVNDNRVEFDKFTFCKIRQKKFVIQIQTTNLTIFQIQNTCNMISIFKFVN